MYFLHEYILTDRHSGFPNIGNDRELVISAHILLGMENNRKTCRMSIIIKGNVALSNLGNSPVALSNLRNSPVALSNLRNHPVACH